MCQANLSLRRTSGHRARQRGYDTAAGAIGRGSTPSEPSAAQAAARSLGRDTDARAPTRRRQATRRRRRPRAHNAAAITAAASGRARNACASSSTSATARMSAARGSPATASRDADDERWPRRRELADAPKLPGVDERLGHEFFPEEHVRGAAPRTHRRRPRDCPRSRTRVPRRANPAPARARMP